ncbi:MAG: DUF938 domain-containing protein [Pseudomonadota bacterium]|nr:DUF938 domain-containing protein [Pseudomonadota bacterium]
MSKPFIPAADRNKDPIVTVLTRILHSVEHVLEIGSGMGQHAVHFAAKLPHLVWQPSDLPVYQEGIRSRADEARLTNLNAPIVLDVMQHPWPRVEVDAVYSANTVHYMPWASVLSMFREISRLLPRAGVFALYGPFNYDGKFVSEGNRQLDKWLKSEDSRYGIRDFEALEILAADLAMRLREDCSMPANNRLLVWERA